MNKGLIFGLIFVGLFLMISVGYSEDLSDWQYRQPITINNPNNDDLSDFQVGFNVSYNSNMNSDFSDLRFTDSNSNVIPYWIENKEDSNWAYVWVKVSSLPANSDTTIYMYFGNSNATDESNGDNVFEFFDNASSDKSSDYSFVDIYSDGETGSISWNSSEYYVLTHTQGDNEFLQINGLSMDNFWIQADFRLETTGSNYQAGFVGRYDSDKYYIFRENDNTKKLEINRVDGGTSATALNDTSISTDGNWHTLEAKLVGSNLEFDGYGTSTTASDSDYTSGTLGIFFAYDTDVKVDFKNVRVGKAVANEPTTTFGSVEENTNTTSSSDYSDGNSFDWYNVSLYETWGFGDNYNENTSDGLLGADILMQVNIDGNYQYTKVMGFTSENQFKNSQIHLYIKYEPSNWTHVKGVEICSLNMESSADNTYWHKCKFFKLYKGNRPFWGWLYNDRIYLGSDGEVSDLGNGIYQFHMKMSLNGFMSKVGEDGFDGNYYGRWAFTTDYYDTADENSVNTSNLIGGCVGSHVSISDVSKFDIYGQGSDGYIHDVSSITWNTEFKNVLHASDYVYLVLDSSQKVWLDNLIKFGFVWNLNTNEFAVWKEAPVVQKGLSSKEGMTLSKFISSGSMKNAHYNENLNSNSTYYAVILHNGFIGNMEFWFLVGYQEFQTGKEINIPFGNCKYHEKVHIDKVVGKWDKEYDSDEGYFYVWKDTGIKIDEEYSLGHIYSNWSDLLVYDEDGNMQYLSVGKNGKNNSDVFIGHRTDIPTSSSAEGYLSLYGKDYYVLWDCEGVDNDGKLIHNDLSNYVGSIDIYYDINNHNNLGNIQIDVFPKKSITWMAQYQIYELKAGILNLTDNNYYYIDNPNVSVWYKQNIIENNRYDVKLNYQTGSEPTGWQEIKFILSNDSIMGQTQHLGFNVTNPSMKELAFYDMDGKGHYYQELELKSDKYGNTLYVYVDNQIKFIKFIKPNSDVIQKVTYSLTNGTHEIHIQYANQEIRHSVFVANSEENSNGASDNGQVNTTQEKPHGSVGLWLNIKETLNNSIGADIFVLITTAVSMGAMAYISNGNVGLSGVIGLLLLTAFFSVGLLSTWIFVIAVTGLMALIAISVLNVMSR